MSGVSHEKNGSFVILFNESNQIALVQHTYGDKKLSLPGGGVGLGETPLTAAVREFYEETGYITTELVMDLVAVLTHKLSYGLVFLFHCKRLAEALCKDNNVNDQEISQLVFMSEEQIEALSEEEIYPAQKRLILDHYKKWKGPGNFAFDKL